MKVDRRSRSSPQTASLGVMVAAAAVLLVLAAPAVHSRAERPSTRAGQSGSSVSRDWAHAVEIQRDGKIVVAGRSVGRGRSRFALARYTATGKLDPSFGRGGKVLTDFGSRRPVGALAGALAIQPDGKLVLAGTSQNEVAIARYTPTGRLDARFGRGGKLLTDFGSGRRVGALAEALAIQSDHKLVVAGESGDLIDGPTYFALVRYTQRGRVDPTFGRAGKVTTTFGPGAGGAAAAVATLQDRRIIAAGWSDVRTKFYFALAGYTAGGKLDPTFGRAGRVLTGFGGVGEAHAVAIQPDGKIVAVGRAGFSDFALARYTADGRLDPSFGGAGKVVTDFCPGECPGGYISHEEAEAVSTQADGKIVAAGWSDVRTAQAHECALVRYTADGSLDPSFGANGKVLTRLGRYSEADDIRIQADGKIVAVGGGAGYFAMARYTANGRLDPSFGRGGRVMTRFR